jgi:transcriptional regulator with XRE-family HTH domain
MSAKKKLTIEDIAKSAGVSIKTVSRVFNNAPNVRQQKRDLVLGVARDLGFRPNISARQLASNRSFVISHFHDNPNKDYLSEIYDGMRRACSEQGYYAVAEKLAPQKGSYRNAFLEYLRLYEVDGVILSPPVSDDNAVIREIQKLGIPHVLISPGKKKKGSINVFINEEMPDEALPISSSSAAINNWPLSAAWTVTPPVWSAKPVFGKPLQPRISPRKTCCAWPVIFPCNRALGLLKN